MDIGKIVVNLEDDAKELFVVGWVIVFFLSVFLGRPLKASINLFIPLFLQVETPNSIFLKALAVLNPLQLFI